MEPKMSIQWPEERKHLSLFCSGKPGECTCRAEEYNAGVQDAIKAYQDFINSQSQVSGKEELDQVKVSNCILNYCKEAGFPYPHGVSWEICAKFKPVDVPSVDEIIKQMRDHSNLDGSLDPVLFESVAQEIHALLVGRGK